MATTTCPHCQREIQFDLSQLSPVFQCARCGGRFTPVGEPVIETSAVEESPYDYSTYDRPKSNAARNTIIAFVIFAMVAFMIMIGVIVAKSNDSENNPPAASSQAKTKPGNNRTQVERYETDTTSKGLFSGLFCILLVFAIVYLFCVIMLMAWVARDCRARGVDGGAVWVFTILFVHWIGLLIYLASRPHGILVPCARCGNKRLQAAVMCPHCGVKTEG
jgi:DNA-directed RNA polymerase subunit RPC12/RpoP